MTVQTSEPLISSVAAAASTNAFARLAKAASPDERRQPAGGITVEQLVVDLLAPMLRDWLDQNLPGIVESVVEQEVKKLARRAELT
jgi:cell pole-organizing protein PopZ